MTSVNPKKRLPLVVVADLLSACCVDKHYKLTNFALLAFKKILERKYSVDNYLNKIKDLSVLLKNLSGLMPTLKRPLTEVEQKIFIAPLEQIPIDKNTEWNSPDNIKKICFTREKFSENYGYSGLFRLQPEEKSSHENRKDNNFRP